MATPRELQELRDLGSSDYLVELATAAVSDRKSDDAESKPEGKPLAIRMWLWFRFVAGTFGVLTALAMAASVVYGVILTWNYWHWVWAGLLTATVASLVIGTGVYVADRGDSPQNYR